MVAKACRLIEEYETIPALAELAEYAEFEYISFPPDFQSNNWGQSKLIFDTILTQLKIDFERRSS